MDFLVDEGLVRYIGVSNFNIAEMEEAQKHAKHRIVTNQFHYSLQARDYEQAGIVDYCRSHDILITAYRPLSKGELTKPGFDLLDRISQKYGKTPAQLALNWVIGKSGVVALVKTSNPAHLAENLGALGWRLERDDEFELDQKFPRGETLNAPQISRFTGDGTTMR